ncbi:MULTISPECIES: sugar ABC transporter substrate-binding protein [unclassified Arthrobacter]|uniref:ABC transporter substrate-binding protein n=2 Tax=Arthrobacter TaxID=1663 RepID=UPI001E30D40B|nr:MULTISPECIES: sugar ABC transporter substrate-binding protein [unclassified Arthrobacter]MCC9144492.1 sugar ABC transporter substrate-binding protein [Arthrobacter sp. zg-Y919]MDK1275718.1 sugar ABC transporter substrate-binding protein [Arthrobacter sp. zg.Y919]MDM7991349.1 sugar ABC transporter substrate-binding protein [Arthrobacter sp. zg-Y877]WIB02915.1 sugar ABC transporter substrate-binding protein [Arthrobacter sp. zg-Y919]
MKNHTGNFGLITRAAIASIAAGALLTGCAASEGPSAEAEVESFDWRNFEGRELNLLMSEHPLSASIKKNLPEFEEKTGIKVSIETLSETDYMVKTLTELQSESGSYDVFMTSQPMNYQYAASGWIEDLQPWVDDEKQTAPDYDFDDFYPALIEAERWDTTDFGGAGEGSLWAIPANEEGYALFYRKDILEAAGIEVPQTIDELIAAAKKLDGSEFEGKEISGFVSRGDKTYPTLNPFSTFAGAYGVKDITDGVATVNSPEGIEATKKWVELMGTAPEAASSYTWYEAQQDFIAGNAAFYIDADHMAPDFEREGSAIAGKVGYELPPAGPEGRASSLWLWSLGMNAASEEKGAAWQFIQWATSKEMLTQAIGDGNMNPTRVSVAESPEMAAATEGWDDYNAVWQEILAEHAAWQYAPSSTWPEVGDLWATAIQSAVLGETSVEDALDDAATKIDAAIK